jgi:hypothetical protein
MHVPTIDATNLKSTKATTEPEKLIRGAKKMIDRSLSFYCTDFTWQDTPAASLDTSRYPEKFTPTRPNHLPDA